MLGLFFVLINQKLRMGRTLVRRLKHDRSLTVTAQ